MKHENLFKAIYESIECADDDTMFINPEYVKWADEFELWVIEYEKDKPWKQERYNHDKCITFSYDQANIWFADDISVCPWIKTVFQFFIHSRSHEQDDFQYEP